MINLKRFTNNYTVQITEIGHGGTVRELDLTEKQLQDGMLKKIFEDEVIEKINSKQVEVKGGVYSESFQNVDSNEPIICDVFVNGIVVKDLKNELGI